MKILYKPFAIIAGVIAAKVGQSIFKAVWSKIDEAEPPAEERQRRGHPAGTTREATVGKVVGAAALEAATLAGTKAVVDRASARSFEYLTGFWPGEERAKRKDEEEE